ncbi:LuxR C-terminal-related transcriptional regulator [Aliifodinibius sp. S!AR15-10]|uniref:response regulator transcription factor n=1 Tax=Aliifodinibius sp. S!AR15-10 TaxID=2950437 RepID=UPI00286FF779|nr:LuxR C-terminal-related transcriptional regulator [Aliifodinibius sp. S!AR15-10]
MRSRDGGWDELNFINEYVRPEGMQVQICNDNILQIRYQVVQRDSRLIQQVLNREAFRKRHLPQFRQLTDRETQLLQLLANGFNNPMIAHRLSISRSTVETHRKHLNKKLGIKSYTRLVKFGLAFGLVEF